MKETYSKTTMLKLAAEARKSPDANLSDLFDLFMENKKDLGMYDQVLDAACELCNISHEEVSSGRRYGKIPTARQLTSRILSEMGYDEVEISQNLPYLGIRSTIYSQIRTSKNDELTNKKYAKVLETLRLRFNIINKKI